MHFNLREKGLTVSLNKIVAFQAQSGFGQVDVDEQEYQAFLRTLDPKTSYTKSLRVWHDMVVLEKFDSFMVKNILRLKDAGSE